MAKTGGTATKQLMTAGELHLHVQKPMTKQEVIDTSIALIDGMMASARVALTLITPTSDEDEIPAPILEALKDLHQNEPLQALFHTACHAAGCEHGHHPGDTK